MVLFICLFLPAVLSVWISESLMGGTFRRKQWLYLYVLSVLMTNEICFLIKKYFLGTGMEELIRWKVDMLPGVAANYMTMAIPVSVVLGIVFVVCRKLLRITIEELTDEDA